MRITRSRCTMFLGRKHILRQIYSCPIRRETAFGACEWNLSIRVRMLIAHSEHSVGRKDDVIILRTGILEAPTLSTYLRGCYA